MLSINELVTSSESYKITKQKKTSFFESVSLLTYEKDFNLDMNEISLKLFINSRVSGESDTKKENILVKIWNAIKKFFKMIWGKIVEFKNKIIKWLKRFIKKRKEDSKNNVTQEEEGNKEVYLLDHKVKKSRRKPKVQEDTNQEPIILGGPSSEPKSTSVEKHMYGTDITLPKFDDLSDEDKTERKKKLKNYPEDKYNLYRSYGKMSREDINKFKEIYQRINLNKIIESPYNSIMGLNARETFEEISRCFSTIGDIVSNKTFEDKNPDFIEKLNTLSKKVGLIGKYYEEIVSNTNKWYKQITNEIATIVPTINHSNEVETNISLGISFVEYALSWERYIKNIYDITRKVDLDKMISNIEDEKSAMEWFTAFKNITVSVQKVYKNSAIKLIVVNLAHRGNMSDNEKLLSVIERS